MGGQGGHERSHEPRGQEAGLEGARPANPGFVNLAERILMGREGNGRSSEDSVNGRVVRTQAFFIFPPPRGNWDYVLARSPPLALKTSLRFRHWRKSVSLCERCRRRHQACFFSADLLCAARSPARCKSANGFEKPRPVLCPRPQILLAVATVRG